MVSSNPEKDSGDSQSSQWFNRFHRCVA